MPYKFEEHPFLSHFVHQNLLSPVYNAKQNLIMQLQYKCLGFLQLRVEYKKSNTLKVLSGCGFLKSLYK